MPIAKEKQNAAAAIKAAAAESPVKNCVWSNNNAACANTWFCLSEQLLGQLPKKASDDFKAAEMVKMTELAFWNDLAAETREAEATAITDMLTKLFTNPRLLGASYEPGQNYASAVLAMKTILLDPEKTLCEFAAVVDEQFHFLLGDN